MEFVLNDQIRGPERRDVLDRRARQTLVSAVVAGAIGARPKKSVPWALGVRTSEKRPDFAAPRHQRELVDCRDHHRRRAVIDFLVDDQDRNAGMWLSCSICPSRTRSVPACRRSRSSSFLPTVSTSTSCFGDTSQPHHGQLVSCAGDVPPASNFSGLRMSWIALWLSSVEPGVTLLPTHSPIVNGSLPKDLSPAAASLLPQKLHRADQRRSALELLQRQEPQRVAHDHGQTATAVIAAQIAPEDGEWPSRRRRRPDRLRSCRRPSGTRANRRRLRSAWCGLCGSDRPETESRAG